MATTKPRITITFEQDTYEAVKEFASLTGMPMSKVVSEMTDQSVASLVSTSALLRRAKDAPKAVLEAIGREFDEAASVLVERSSLLDTDYQEVLDGLDDLVESGASAEVSAPPYVNKGVRSGVVNRGDSNGGGSVVSGHFAGRNRK
jgi:hypothetical protein